MSYLQPFLKITFGGQIAQKEIWACSIHYNAGSITSMQELLGDAGINLRTQIVNRLTLLHSSMNGSIPDVTLEYVKFAIIGTNGKYIGDAVTANFTPVPGGYTEVNVSAYNGAAISLYGDVPRNPAGKGRFYPPANAVAATQGYFIGTDVQTRLTTAWRNLFVGIRDDSFATSYPMILINVSEKGTGYEQEVSLVRVGSVLDVQRRRKNRIQEEYISLPFSQ